MLIVQPTNPPSKIAVPAYQYQRTCGYGALATLCFRIDIKVLGRTGAKLSSQKDVKGNPQAAHNQSSWLRGARYRGMQATLYTFDCMIVRLT